MLALDTETTGVALHHGCKPFFVSLCWQHDKQYLTDFHQWEVNPKTREPRIPVSDIYNLQRIIDGNPRLVLQNAKFDIRALSKINVKLPFEKVDDTLVASHVLCSNESHNLKDLALKYLDIPDDDEKELQEATNAARRIGRKLGWDIARPNHPHWPAIKSMPDGWWKHDTWLPRAVCVYYANYGIQALGRHAKNPYPRDPKCRFPEPCKCHPWWHVLAKYAIQDAERTLALWLMYDEALDEEMTYDPALLLRKQAKSKAKPFPLRRLYKARLKQLLISYAMEERGCSINTCTLRTLEAEFRAKQADALRRCSKIISALPYGLELQADDKELNLRSVHQLREILFSKSGLALPPKKSAKQGHSTDKDVILELLDEVEPDSKAFQFLQNLVISRKATKHLEYLAEYQAAGLPS